EGAIAEGRRRRADVGCAGAVDAEVRRERARVDGRASGAVKQTAALGLVEARAAVGVAESAGEAVEDGGRVCAGAGDDVINVVGGDVRGADVTGESGDIGADVAVVGVGGSGAVVPAVNRDPVLQLERGGAGG